MNEKEAQERAMAELEPEASRMGFSRALRWNFTRPTGGDVVNILSVGVNSTTSGGFSLGCGVGIRFNQVESLIARTYHDASKATIGMPIHLLRPDPKYDQWFFTNAASLKRVVPEVVADIRTYALPFFDKYSSLENVRHQLEQEPPQSWFVLDREGRIKVLTGILFAQEGPRKALAWLSAKLSEPPTKPPLPMGELLTLKKRLESLVQAAGPSNEIRFRHC
jgi:hypothetical protein